MSTHIPARVQPGVPTGGQFATSARAESAVELFAQHPSRVETIRVNVDHVPVQTGVMGKVPAWPADLPEPEPSYSWGENNDLDLRVDFGDEHVTFWGDNYHGLENSLEELPSDEQPNLTDEQRAQVIAYGEALHTNVDYVVSTFDFANHTPQVRSAVLAVASGSPAPGATTPDFSAGPREAGLEMFTGVLEVLHGRESIPPQTLASLPPERIEELYGAHIGPAIDAIEADIVSGGDATGRSSEGTGVADDHQVFERLAQDYQRGTLTREQMNDAMGEALELIGGLLGRDAP